jgi:SAM-dependent methyltransferase
MTQPTRTEQATKLQSHLAGYVATRTINLGLRHGLLDALAANQVGLDPDELARRTGLDLFYTRVWCQAAFAAAVLDQAAGGRYRLASHLDNLLLDPSSPAHVGATFVILEHPEIFEQFSDHFGSGLRTWWDQQPPAFIDAVAATGTPFYTRLIPGGLDRVPGLADRLAAGGRVLELACGAGVGLARLADTYPAAQLVGVDGDVYSLKLAAQRLEEAGASDRVELVACSLEELALNAEFELAVINISMHECRDLDRVTANVRRALRPSGWFVISDFPFPDTPEGLRSLPGQTMTAIQFFEALIGDQLLPTATYLELLAGHGFRDVDSFELTPTHVVVHGKA